MPRRRKTNKFGDEDKDFMGDRFIGDMRQDSNNIPTFNVGQHITISADGQITVTGNNKKKRRS